MTKRLLSLLVGCLIASVSNAQSSKITFCRLDKSLDFNGQSAILNALQIIHVTIDTDSNRAVVQYREGWTVSDVTGTVTSIQGPSDHVFQWTWGPQVIDEAGNVLIPAFQPYLNGAADPNLTRATDLALLIYKYLSVSRIVSVNGHISDSKEYACRVITGSGQ